MRLRAEGLSIMRGERVLFRAQSLRLEAGEAVLLRGANGTGKTSFLRCLAGLARPETGRCERALFHWVGHSCGIKPHETPAEHLRIWARAYGADRHATGKVVALMGLERAQDVPGAQLSAGQRKRTALGRTQLQIRPLWLLDEPFTALDQAGSDLLARLIAQHRASGGAVVAAVHGAVQIPDAREMQL